MEYSDIYSTDCQSFSNRRYFYNCFPTHSIDIVLMQHTNVSETNSRLKNAQMENNVFSEEKSLRMERSVRKCYSL